VPHLAWLGLSPFDLDGVDPASLQPLTPRDRALASGIAARPEMPAAWAACAQEMLDRGCKAELESLYSRGGVGQVLSYVLRKLATKDWVT